LLKTLRTWSLKTRAQIGVNRRQGFTGKEIILLTRIVIRKEGFTYWTRPITMTTSFGQADLCNFFVVSELEEAAIPG
jgi:hypothetical protein